MHDPIENIKEALKNPLTIRIEDDESVLYFYKEQKELPNLFLEYLPKNYLPKRILNFCCGIVNEEPILYNMYGKNIEKFLSL